MDFDAEYVRFLESVAQDMQKDFTISRDTMIAGRWVPLSARFDLRTERKLFGIMPTGNFSHSHEICVFIPIRQLDDTHFTEMLTYFETVQKSELVLDAEHEFTIFTLVLLHEGSLSSSLQKSLRRLDLDRKLQYGFTNVRVVAVDLQDYKVCVNKVGAAAADRLKPSIQRMKK